MHNKYEKDGLVILSVHLLNPDDVETAEARAKAAAEARKFLDKIKAPFTNVLLDEPPDVWMKRLDAGGAPIMFVFNRANRIEAKYLDTEEATKGLDKLLPELLKK